MLDSMREKCHLHIRAARIFVMQLELLEIRRLVALCHNEGPIVAEEAVFATAQALSSGGAGLVNSRVAFGSPRPSREKGTVRVRWCG